MKLRWKTRGQPFRGLWTLNVQTQVRFWAWPANGSRLVTLNVENYNKTALVPLLPPSRFLSTFDSFAIWIIVFTHVRFLRALNVTNWRGNCDFEIWPATVLVLDVGYLWAKLRFSTLHPSPFCWIRFCLVVVQFCLLRFLSGTFLSGTFLVASFFVWYLFVYYVFIWHVFVWYVLIWHVVVWYVLIWRVFV